MKRIVLVFLLVLCGAGFGLVTPELERHMTTAQADQLLPVHIVFNKQFDTRLLNSLVDGMPRRQRRGEVARILRDFSAREQTGMVQFLAGKQAEGAVKDITPLWIVNVVYCEATPAVIRQVSEMAEVNYVNYDLAYAPNLLETAEPASPTEEITWGVDKVNAPAVWALGYTGQGVVCGHIDTGCNYNHTDLADHMWTDSHYPHAGWNFENNTDDPIDAQGHGTHTAGTVAGDGTGGSQTGVAPDAQIMVCRVRTVADSVAESQCWQSMEFVTSPPLNPDSGADLYTMSLGWMIAWNPHQAVWRTTANNVNAAGLTQCVAAGNERGTPIPNACRCPGNTPPPWWNPQNTGVGALSGITSIGATDNSDAIAGFSSPGPVTWSGVAGFDDYPYPPGLSRPDVSAPGVDVKSCAMSGGYTQMSGTSMATPHTAGVVCLLLSKNPDLTPREVDSLLEITSVDLGPSGKDNDFGAGRIDALAGVNATPFPGPRHDVALGGILAPTDSIFPELPLAPVVEVKNRGNYVEPSVTVHCKVDSAGSTVYDQQIVIPVLDTLVTDTVTFPNWNVGPGGNTYSVTFWHSYSPDTVHSNDTVRTSTLSRGHDIGITGCNIDSVLRANRPFAPIANVTNVGGYVERAFSAWCKIDSAGTTIYSQSVAIDSLGLGATQNVVFPSWRVGENGTPYTVKMYHTVSPDVNSANDTLVRHPVATVNSLRIAIELATGAHGRTPPNAIYSIDTLCRSRGWTTAIVTGNDINSWEELNNYDCVVTGDDGFGDNDFASYQSMLYRWVKSGGGFVSLGWHILGVSYTVGPNSAMDSLCPVMAAGGSMSHSNGYFRITDTLHPVTRYVGNFSIYEYGEYAPAGLRPWASALACYSDAPAHVAVAAGTLDSGRSVYLGPIYFGDFAAYENERYFTDPNAALLLIQAISWASTGPGPGIQAPVQPKPVRDGLTSIRPNPLASQTLISYSLLNAGNAEVSIYDLAGNRVRTLVTGHQPAGVQHAVWNRTDDAGRNVAAGVYFCRFEADQAVATRKLVVR